MGDDVPDNSLSGRREKAVKKLLSPSGRIQVFIVLNIGLCLGVFVIAELFDQYVFWQYTFWAVFFVVVWFLVNSWAENCQSDLATHAIY